MKKFSLLRALATITLVAVFCYFGWLYISDTLFVTSSDETIYLYQDGNNYYLVTVCPNNEIIFEQTYCGEDGMAAEEKTFAVHGQTGKRLFGQYYFLSDSLLSLQKAPLDTVPAFVTLTCTDYNAYGIDTTNRIQKGDSIRDYIYCSENYFVIDGIEHVRISEEEIPAEVILPIALMWAELD